MCVKMIVKMCLRMCRMRISYGRVRGSGYNARNGNNVAICPVGEKKKKIFKLQQAQLFSHVVR